MSPAVKKIVILAQENSPTRDLYLPQRLQQTALPVEHWKLGALDRPDLNGAYVIIVRYLSIPSAWVLARAKRQGRLAGVAYLLDDNIPAAPFDASLPWDYRIEMAFDWLRWGRFLHWLADEFWLSSDNLLQCLAGGSACHRIDPWPLPFTPPAARWPDPKTAGITDRSPQAVQIFYHGVKTHRLDRAWLQPVVARVLAACPQARFELIGGQAARRLFGEMPGVRVRAPMAWPDYLAWSRQEPYDIGLAPLQDSAFARARSWSKYVDIARFGAIGVFADCPAYRSVIRNGENGLLIDPNDRDAWAEAVIGLVADRALRRHMAGNFALPQMIATPPALQALMKPA